MKLNDFFLSLGSNIEPAVNLPESVKILGEFGLVIAVSATWESSPFGFSEQPNYLNAALHLKSSRSIDSFQSEVIPEVEARLGRVRGKNKFGPRSIDVDIMLYNNEILMNGPRPIPSPEIEERAFVAIPLAEIAPDYQHPVLGKPLSAIASDFDPGQFGMVKRTDINLEV